MQVTEHLAFGIDLEATKNEETSETQFTLVLQDILPLPNGNALPLGVDRYVMRSHTIEQHVYNRLDAVDEPLDSWPAAMAVEYAA